MKIKRYKDLPISGKMLSLVLITILPLFLIISFYILPILEEKSYDNKKETLKNTIQIAYTVMKAYNDKVTEGKMSLSDAQREASIELNKLRYSGKEYFFAYDNEGITRVLGSDISKVGTNRWDFEDKKGAKFVREMVKIGKEKGEGFLTYYYPKLGETEPLPKLAYIKNFEPWNWNVGTGLYTDDVEAEISKLKTNLFIIILSVVFAVFIIAFYFSKTITNSIKKITQVAIEISNGILGERLSIDQKDEIGTLANAFNSLHFVVGDLNHEVNVLMKAGQDGNLSVRGDSSKLKGEFAKIITGINSMLDSVIDPLNVAAQYVDRIAKGDIPEKISEKYNGDFNKIKNNLNTCIDSINAMVLDTNMLVAAAIDGKLSVRADISKHNGDFLKIVKGINDTLDAVIGPLSVAAEYVERISNGDLPEKITTVYNGDFNTITNNINTLLGTVSTIFAGMKRLAINLSEGKTNERGSTEMFKGDWREFVNGINSIIEGSLSRLMLQADYFEKISKGEIPPVINEEWPGNYNDMRKNINQCITAINLMIEEAGMLSKAAVAGNLSKRADVSKHSGDFKRIIQGVNDTLDAVINPLNVAAEYVDRIAKGEIPDKISENYNGDFNNIKNNINILIGAMSVAANAADEISKGNLNNKITLRSGNDKLMSALIDMTKSIQSMVDDIYKLSDAAVEGKLKERADVTKHQGDFRKIVEGVNNTLDAVVIPLNMAADFLAKVSRGDELTEIKEEYKGDFVLIKNNINTCVTILYGILGEIVKVTDSAVDGELNYRTNSANYKGGWFTIADGINKILDAVITPIKEGVSVLEKMASGDLTLKITSEYKGDHQLIKNSINTVAESLNQALGDVSEAIAATASASNQISSSTEEMAAGSQEQTQQTTEVAGSVEEMTKTILENTKNSSFASETAKDAGAKAHEGGKVVKETIDGMNRIAEVVKKSAETVQELGKSSDQIGEIVQVIDDIADQTNLLALNAAIEAARAGEQGRGFAVVADEVRKLAERTTKATKEIATMIRQIQKDTENAVNSMEEGTKEVERGKALANKAGDSLKEIVEGSQQVLDIVAQVAAASEEQSTTAEEISRNVEAISSVAQESAGGTQQIATAAEDLNRLTLNLENLISQFKLDNQHALKHIESKRSGGSHLSHKDIKRLAH